MFFRLFHMFLLKENACLWFRTNELNLYKVISFHVQFSDKFLISGSASVNHQSKSIYSDLTQPHPRKVAKEGKSLYFQENLGWWKSYSNLARSRPGILVGKNGGTYEG